MLNIAGEVVDTFVHEVRDVARPGDQGADVVVVEQHDCALASLVRCLSRASLRRCRRGLLTSAKREKDRS